MTAAIAMNCFTPNSMARRRLVCFPFAGGGASAFIRLAKLLPPHVETYAAQFPGREDLLSATPLTDWREALQRAVDALGMIPGERLTFLGCSMGGAFALDVARMLGPRVEALIALACPAPARRGPQQSALRAMLAASDDDALLAAMRQRFGGLPDGLDDPVVRPIATPIIRADLALFATRPAPPPFAINAPIIVIAGADDPLTDGNALEEWSRFTTRGVQIAHAPGDHFFLSRDPKAVAALIQKQLD